MPKEIFPAVRQIPLQLALIHRSKPLQVFDSAKDPELVDFQDMSLSHRFGNVQGLTQFWDHLLPTVATSHWLKPPRLLGRSRVGKPVLLLDAGTKTYAIVADITHMKSF